MSGGASCGCSPRDRSYWRVVTRLANYSAFNGYRHTPSDYSEVICLRCGGRWRTKAKYVAAVADATREEIDAPALDPGSMPVLGEPTYPFHQERRSTKRVNEEVK
jgi:hypothetical protein